MLLLEELRPIATARARLRREHADIHVLFILVLLRVGMFPLALIRFRDAIVQISILLSREADVTPLIFIEHLLRQCKGFGIALVDAVVGTRAEWRAKSAVLARRALLAGVQADSTEGFIARRRGLRVGLPARVVGPLIAARAALRRDLAREVLLTQHIGVCVGDLVIEIAFHAHFVRSFVSRDLVCPAATALLGFGDFVVQIALLDARHVASLSLALNATLHLVLLDLHAFLHLGLAELALHLLALELLFAHAQHRFGTARRFDPAEAILCDGEFALLEETLIGC
jgi:hypothetical protein